MKFQMLKNLPKNCKVKYIHNDILGKNSYEFDENGNYVKKFIPYTDDCRFSHWKIGVEISIKRMHYTAWFAVCQDREHIYCEFIWNGGTGKKLRRDAMINICRKYFNSYIGY